MPNKLIHLLLILLILIVFSGCIYSTTSTTYSYYPNNYKSNIKIYSNIHNNINLYDIKIYFTKNNQFIPINGTLYLKIYDLNNSLIYLKKLTISENNFSKDNIGFYFEYTINKSEIKNSSSNIGRLSIEYGDSYLDIPIELKYSNYSLDYFTKTYIWKYNNKDYKITLYIPKYLYNYYKSKNRAYIDDYSYYVLDKNDDWIIDRLVNELYKISKNENINPLNLAISFVQSLSYINDSTIGYDEYPKYPVETLVDGGGDCEDTSILLASILKQMGYDVALIEFNNHIAVGIALNNSPGYYYSYNNKHYYYIETTSQGWRIGDIPEEYLNKKAKIFVITYNKPLYVWNCKAYLYTERNYKFVKFVFKIKNFGNRTGKFKVYAAFDAGNGYVYNPKESDFITLKPNEERTITLEIPVPNKPYKKIIVGLLDENNSLIDIKYFLEGDYG